MPQQPAGNVVTNALQELGVYGPADIISANNMSWGLKKLSRLIDAMNAQSLSIFAHDFLQFTLPTNIQPFTIGQAFAITSVVANGAIAVFQAKNSFQPNDTVDIYNCLTAGLNGAGQVVTASTPSSFTVATAVTVTENETNAACGAVYTGVALPNCFTLYTRPTKIHSANILLTNTNPVAKVPLDIHQGQAGADWWANVRVPQVTSSVPTDLYYNAQWPNGFIYLWPMQSFAYGLELDVDNLLPPQLAQTTVFSFPEGYENAITYTLAEELAPSYNKVVTQQLAMLAIKSRAVIRSLNSSAPKISTKDNGIPQGGRDTYFNWLNGGIVAR